MDFKKDDITVTKFLSSFFNDKNEIINLISTSNTLREIKLFQLESL